jgi:hypothetical protein
VVGWNISLGVVKDAGWCGDEDPLRGIHAAAGVAGCSAHQTAPTVIEVRGQFAAASGRPDWDLPALVQARRILGEVLRKTGVRDGICISYPHPGVSPITVGDVEQARAGGVEVRFIPC